MSSGTISSIFQMRKRRNDDSVTEVMSGKSKSPRSQARQTNTSSPSISRTPTSHHPRSRQSVRDTSVRFLCSQSESQSEISWDCNSPEYVSKRKPGLRNVGSDSKDNILNLVHDAFNIAQGKDEPKNTNNNLLAFWMAPTEGKVSQTLPIKTLSSSTSGFKPPPVRHHVEQELEQLVSKVELNKAQQKAKGTSSKVGAPGKDINISASAEEKNLREIQKKDPSSNTRNEEINISEDIWEDEDLFNDGEFLAQTQKLMDDYAQVNSSQASTQLIVRSEDLDDSSEESTTENPFNFTAIREKTKQSASGSSRERENMSSCPGKRDAIDLDDLWNSDDGLDEILCTLAVPECEQDSLDLLLNCSTEPYPSPAGSPVLQENEAKKFQTSDQTEAKLPEKSKSPWVFDSKPGPSKSVMPITCKMTSHMNSLPGTQLKTMQSNDASKSIPAQSQYTAEQIEKKRQKAMEIRRQKLALSTFPTTCQVIYSQIMPSSLKS